MLALPPTEEGRHSMNLSQAEREEFGRRFAEFREEMHSEFLRKINYERDQKMFYAKSIGGLFAVILAFCGGTWAVFRWHESTPHPGAAQASELHALRDRTDKLATKDEINRLREDIRDIRNLLIRKGADNGQAKPNHADGTNNITTNTQVVNLTPTGSNAKEWLTPREAAMIFPVNEDTVRRHARAVYEGHPSVDCMFASRSEVRMSGGRWMIRNPYFISAGKN